MLQKPLQALPIISAERTLKCAVLTTGAKRYGVHLGPVKILMKETDSWTEDEGRPPNFYYLLRRIVIETSASSKERTGGCMLIFLGG
ncbi:hypothetical protein BDV29DRAFT_185850 [Aspergillus leporis]|jgi:hypothetical protein|uniref:Uncharacterized protein n=1 Tax=Aspergillus leporis TaxID=41062 RepID=A0A5N5WGX9_9EURO|nr:hypothetical protein BDV29DRAFT_185850 [Aspergillus leporis]